MNTAAKHKINSSPQIADWLRLAHAQGLSLSNKHRLLSHFGNLTAILEAPLAELRSVGAPSETIAALQSDLSANIEQDLRWAENSDNHLIDFHHKDYPGLLKELNDPPLVLYVKGDSECLGNLQLAVVGSRKASPSGLDAALEFAKHLAACGITITSGMALGIDAAAHKGALKADGLTVAVAGTGLDRVYPSSHQNLAHAIAESGALVSEFPVGTPPRRENFPRRNRIISGLASGTLVVEAALRSGSLITARHALEQGREVFAIPGSIHNPLSKGCHTLIRQGAKLVENSQHILEELAPLAALTRVAQATPQSSDSLQHLEISEDNDYETVLAQLDHAPTSLDTLVERSGLAASAIASMLLILELRGQVISLSGGRYQRSP